MYTLEQLRDKTFKELKGIGWELNVLPAGDRRCRQNWIDAIAGVNPPLLALLEVSPGVEVESVAEAIEVQAQEAIEIQALVSFQIGDLVESIHERWGLEEESLTGTVIFVHPSGGVRVNFGAGGTFDYSRPGKDLIKTSIEVQVQEPKFDRIIYPKLAVQPIALAVETSPGVKSCTEADRPPNRGDNGRGRIESEPKLSQSAIGLTGKTSIAHQLLELFKSSAHIIEDSPAAETEAEMLESAMAFRPASYGLTAENLLDAEANDRNPISTGITFSDSFLARYSPPQPENIHYQADANGQLSLLDFEVESVDEPPDPDDFEGDMFAFWAAYDAWCERTDDDSEQFEPLEISLTSMCEWAPCPLDWYEPAETNETIETNETVSCTLEISPVSIESSSTCKFLIPVFDAWCDRPNGKDEPPTAGVGARLPKPKPPSFPSASVPEGDRSSIKQFARSAILLSGRAPPGGDAM